MPYEILYTSAPSGLKPGSSGYCTVKSSRGIPAPAVDLLESLSGYRHVFTPGSLEAARNPVNWGHYLLRISGRTEHVLSRVSDCELDYTGRSNKLAHHMVIDATCPAGPAWLVGQPGWMIGQWDGQVEQFGTVRKAPPERRAAGRCAAWEAATGDAGWGGVLAESFLADPERKVFLIYRPDQNILPLIEEAIALLPENRRWEVTFATYGAALPKTVECAWTGVVAGSPEVQQSQRFVNALRIDLTAPMPKAEGASLVSLARTGQIVKVRPDSRRGAPTTGDAAAAIPELPRRHVQSGTVVPEIPIELHAVYDESHDETEPPSLPTRTTRRSATAIFAIGLLTAAMAISVITAGTFYLIWRKKLSPPPLTDDSSLLAQAETTSPDAAGAEVTTPVTESSDKELRRDGSKDVVPERPAMAPENRPAPQESTAETPPPTEPPKTPASPQPPTPQPPITQPEDAKPPKTPDAVPEGQPSGKVTPRDDAAPATPPKEERVQFLVSSKKTYFPKTGDDSLIVEFGKAVSPMTTVSSAALLVPRGRETDGTSYLNSTEQRFRDGTCTVARRNAVGAANDQLEIRPQLSAEPSVKLTVKIPFGNDIWRDAVGHGALLLRSETEGKVSVLCFSPAAGKTEKQLVLDENSGGTELTTPVKVSPETLQFLKAIPREDVSLSGLILKISDLPLSPSGSVAGEMHWDLTTHSKGLVTSLSVKESGVLSSDDQLRIRVTSKPPLKELEQKLRMELGTIQKKHDELRGLVPPGDLMTGDVFLYRPAFPQDHEKLTRALSEAKTRTADYFESLRKTKKDSPTSIDKSEKEVLAAIDEYATAVESHRDRHRILGEIKKKMSVVSGVISYKAWPIGEADSKAGVAAMPSDQKFANIILWTIAAD